MNRIDAGLPPSAFSSTTSHADIQHGQQQVGTMLGQAAVAVDGEVSLADSAEELSLHMAEKTEDKHHAERKIGRDAPLQLLSAEAIVAYLAESHDADAQEKLIELARHLLAGGADPRQAAARAFGDAARQYLGLQYALRQGERDGAPEDVLDGLREALADLELESGPQIRASLNTIGAAAGYADDARGVADFQRTYQDVVLGEASLAKTLALALERFGGKDVGRGLQQLIQALGQDLAAARPSTSPDRLQALMQDLYQLGVAVTVLDGCGELGAKMARDHGKPLAADRLMQDLVNISNEKWLSESRFAALAASHGADSVAARITFLGGVRAVLKDLPLPMFPDVDARQSALSAAQLALDAAIDEEYE
ncbi:type III secretion system gatekeeper subunit SctW [Achromobacter ruhlandii]|uniref:type III secretion system gatekeeper subunit SctW n=1 Tax=Achromobacter ruhlandii TaxID=72557 RepID=UPI0021F1AFD9|nr:type III secretion system gatekeeper subunit SctW [Achromobacter ruhlandii]MCV6796440.1 type III secretion system gatekeeper subunit SctW [Achromobacter ruhlandii]MCV6804604.1 type III secretion system gatekeeper subunit SctW [Achromobacter ruhlandii]MCV6809048.1 type III secretion system gatekeeper subunit SctW [Achromobacter ruhlandii]MCV6820890.1 type III secretion system gatekeeper subunit SctW [Achromobacter ruhlandii]